MHIYHITFVISVERYLGLICTHLDRLRIYLGKDPDAHMRVSCTVEGSACVVGVQLISMLEYRAFYVSFRFVIQTNRFLPTWLPAQTTGSAPQETLHWLLRCSLMARTLAQT